MRHLAELYNLWDVLSDVPVLIQADYTLVLDESFEHFPIGTPLGTVWHWFEGQHPKFCVDDVQRDHRRGG
jgi:hypothetical protein